jgi:murein DD-endopeptidase MepM/ murein hydrolase activator NlpD/Na+-transporting methylmalonyl-CoA/oxaloacetate decarboxylase gamma subunit
MQVMPTNNGGAGKIVIIAAIGAVLLLLVFLVGLIMLLSAIIGGNNNNEKQAQKEIAFQSLYQSVADKHNIPWTILAAIHIYSDVYDIHLEALTSGSAASLKGKDPEVLRLIDTYAKKRNLEPLLVAAVIQQESGWNEKARSHAGAMGLMQVMPFHFKSGENGYDRETNIERGTKILQDCVKRFGIIRVALACYNGGPGVIKNGQVPSSPRETAEYPGKVLAHYNTFKAEDNAKPASNDNDNDKNKVKMADVEKWLNDTAKRLAEQLRIQSDSSRRSPTCTKEAEKKKDDGMTVATISVPLTCSIFYTAPSKYTSSDSTTWNYVQKVESKSLELMHADGPVSYGNIVMAGGTFPLPVPQKITVSSSFGCRKHPVTGEVGSFHWGSDIPVPSYTPVLTVADGTVELVKTDTQIGYQVIVNHGALKIKKNGKMTTANVKTRYLHMMSVTVKQGQRVTKGQTIAKSGGDPRIQRIRLSTGPHLHFEVYINGAVVNPFPLLTGRNDNPDLSCPKAKAAMGLN